jgi:hypothetical protein
MVAIAKYNITINNKVYEKGLEYRIRENFKID